ncbi:hypothetical protein [Pedobacter steynii]|uniref:Uncharacterized protein n=1 Tax=Pedobacter steynii TaxID=430522 RepID=A0A1D7QB41_9SPHI|nr:hypothetical protein [Pedobacter steynii]AOM75910.1 hypothetical protein BFS30_01215 [Pedobacter steynii]
MKTSWNELRLIEDYLSSDGRPEDKVLFEAQLILQPDLKDSVYWQQKTYDLLQEYGRQQLRSEIKKVHELLFSAPEHQFFRQKIRKLFRK